MLTNWSSKKQRTVTLSSTEAEYIAIANCAQEAKFTNMLLKELFGEVQPAIIYGDNTGALHLIKNRQVGPRTKHIDIRHHFLRNMHEDKEADFRFKRSEDNLADGMTKNLSGDLFKKHKTKLRDGNTSLWREDVKEAESE